MVIVPGMPVPIQAFALDASKDVIIPTAKQGLRWKPVRPDEGGAALPWLPGVYIWVAPGSPEPVLYIGSGSGQLGLRARLGKEFTLVVGAARWDPGTRADEWPGHARTLAARSGFTYYAITEDGDTAKTWERRLLQHSLRLTGLVPIVNGGGWWNNKPHFETARQWSRAAGGKVAVP